MANEISQILTPPKPVALKAKQLRAVELLAAGENVTKTAKQLGVRRETIHAWSQSHEFQVAIRSTILERRGFARAKLEALVDLALDALEKDLTEPDTPVAVRQRAALAVLDRIGYASRTENQMDLSEPLAPPPDLSRLTLSEMHTLRELRDKIAGRQLEGTQPSVGCQLSAGPGISNRRTSSKQRNKLAER